MVKEGGGTRVVATEEERGDASGWEAAAADGESGAREVRWLWVDDKEG